MLASMLTWLVVVVVVSASRSHFTLGLLAYADVKVDVFEKRMRIDGHWSG